MHQKNNFDGLRLVGASLVLISHEFPLSAREEPLIAGVITLGQVGLMLFFSISGYLVTQSWIRDPSLQRFAARRFLRIWPALAGFVVVSSAALACVTADFDNALKMLWNLIPWRILDARVFHNNPIHITNGSLWSIPLEIACYAGFTVVAMIAGKSLRYALGISSILAVTYGVVFGVAVQTGRIPAGVPYLPFLASFFFIGSAFAFWQPTTVAAVVAFVLAALSVWALHNATLALILIIPVITVTVGTQSWWVLRDAGKYGDFSYGLYLWAWPMQQITIAFLGPGNNVIVLLVVSIIAAFVFAFASWHLIEAPALRFKPRNPQKRHTLIEIESNAPS